MQKTDFANKFNLKKKATTNLNSELRILSL